MKKKGALVAFVLMLIFVCSITVGASTTDVDAELRPDFKIYIDGELQTFSDANGTPVYPVLYNGSTYLPLRAVGDALGMTVGWDGTTQTVTLDSSENLSEKSSSPTNPDTTAVITPVSAQLRPDFKIYINGELQEFKNASGNIVYPLLYNGSTYLPLRSVGDALNMNVSWDGENQIVRLTKQVTITVEEITEKVLKNINGITSTAYDISIYEKYSRSSDVTHEKTLECEVELVYDSHQISLKENYLHTENSETVSVSYDTHYLIKKDNGDYAEYTHIKTDENDYWVRRGVNFEALNYEYERLFESFILGMYPIFNETSNYFFKMEDIDKAEFIGTEQINGKTAYRIDYTLTSSELNRAIRNSGIPQVLEKDVPPAFAVKEASENEKVIVSVWVSASDFYPVKYEFKADNFMNAAIKTTVDAIESQNIELLMHASKNELDVTDIVYDEIIFSITIKDINSIDTITLPPESIHAKTIG